MSITAPTDITSLDVWIDASVAGDFSFSGGTTVSQWNDRSGNGHNCVAVSGGAGPERTGSQNGLTTVTFASSSAAWGTSGYSPAGQPITLFAVAKVANTSWGGVVGGGAGVQGVRRQGDNSLGFDWGSGVGYAMDNTNYHLIIAVVNGASSKQRIDSVQVGTANTGSGVPGLFAVGSDNDGNHMDGNIAEAGLYAKALNSTELTDLEAYLTAKWFGAPATKAPPLSRRRSQRALMRRAA